MPVAAVTTSAAGSLNLLEDEDKEIRGYALNHLLTIVPQFWAEISEKISWLEVLADSDSQELSSTYQPYAALLLSKIYHYIGQDEEAVEFALRAGPAFEKEVQGEYRDTIIAGCLDMAIRQTKEGAQLDPSLSAIVEAVLRAGTTDHGKLAIGLALSLRRLDLLETFYIASRAPVDPSSSDSSKQVLHDESMLRYVLNEAISGTSGNENWPINFRADLFKILLRLFQRSPVPDWSSMTIIWVQLRAAGPTVEALAKLCSAGDHAQAYQIAFDLYEIAPQGFVTQVRQGLVSSELGPDEALEGNNVRNVLERILSGVESAKFYLNFMAKNAKTDFSILQNVKDSVEDRYSIYHSAISFSQAFACCGTASDAFLRDNLTWVARATNWAKFSTTSSLGLLHKGSIVRGRNLVKPYLPGGSHPDKYSEGGALYALGLIYAGRQHGAEDDLKNGLAEGMDPVVQHGAALGYGISAVASLNDGIYENLRTVLFSDNATSGEGAGYAMGLVMLGSKSDKALEEMMSYARETQHEKIIRGLAIGIAFVMYEQREGADAVIEEMTTDQNSIIRYGGMFTIALAYAGTGSNKVVKRLLHVAVSDVNDDVRRAAVTALGFVLFRNHTQVPRVVQLLAESYNPHVRHGAALALGISCAGTGLEAAVELLEPMTRDPIDFVRQGAYIALAFVLIQQSEAQSPRSTAIRELFTKVVADKHEDPVARFGATVALGIIDAGGRNATLSLATRAGTLNMQAIVGVTLFVQFWYWYPLAHGLGMAFSPTAVIAVDDQLRLPEVEFTCHAKPSTFAYTTKAKKETEKKEKKAVAAVLSTTAKANARQKKKAAEGGEDVEMDKAEEAPTPKPTTPKRTKPSEPNQFTVKNMARVTHTQFPFLSFNANDSLSPVRPIGESLIKDKKTSPFNCGSVVVLKGESSGKFIELDDALWNGPRTPAAAPAPPTPVAAVPEEEVELVGEGPQTFEYPFGDERRGA